MRVIKNMEPVKIHHVESPENHLQDDKRIAKLSKADPFLTSIQISGQMAADNGV